MEKLTSDNIFNKVTDIRLTAQILALKENESWYTFDTHETAIDFLASYAAYTEWLIRKCDNEELLRIYKKIVELFETKTKIYSEDFLEDPVISYIYYCNGPIVMVELNEACLSTN